VYYPKNKFSRIYQLGRINRVELRLFGGSIMNYEKMKKIHHKSDPKEGVEEVIFYVGVTDEAIEQLKLLDIEPKMITSRAAAGYQKLDDGEYGVMDRDLRVYLIYRKEKDCIYCVEAKPLDAVIEGFVWKLLPPKDKDEVATIKINPIRKNQFLHRKNRIYTPFIENVSITNN
jgi:hypothetical protein